MLFAASILSLWSGALSFDVTLAPWVRKSPFFENSAAAERGYKVIVSEPDVSLLAVQGPLAGTVLERLCGAGVHDLKYFWFQGTEIEGIQVVVARSGLSK